MTTAPLSRLASYDLQIVWSTGTDADTSAYDHPSYLTPPGLVIDGIGRAQQRAYGPAGTPALDATLPNTDGTYSPGGPLGSFVGRGPEVAASATWGTEILGDADNVPGDTRDLPGDGTFVAPLFAGAIDTAPQQIDNPASVQVRALGRMALLTDSRPAIPVYEDIRTDEAIALILDAAGWPADARVLDAGDTTLTYFWADGQADAASLIEAVRQAEGTPACVYELAGAFHFEGRQYRANARRSTEVQWYLFDGPQGSGNPPGDDPFTLGDDPNVFGDGPLTSLVYHVVPSRWDSNPDEVVATVRASVNVRTPTSVQKIWEYGGPLVLSALEVRDLEATSSDPFTSAVVPLLAADYAISAGSLTSVSLLETSGQKARIRLVAGAGGATVIGVTSNGPQLRAVSLPVTTTVPVTSTVDTALNAARFRPKDYAIPLWPEITANQALDLCNNHARRYQRPGDQMTVQLVNLDAMSMWAILTLAVSDRLRIRHRRAGIDANFHVEQLHHDLATGGGLHRLTLACERVTDDVPARFGSARFGFDAFSE
jgi:hypothetical protein